MEVHPLLNYARNLVARLSESGWRRFFAWGGAYVFGKAYLFAFITAPTLRLDLPDGYYLALNAALALYISAFITREVGKHLERQTPAPGGGLVNNEAIA